MKKKLRRASVVDTRSICKNLSSDCGGSLCTDLKGWVIFAAVMLAPLTFIASIYYPVAFVLHALPLGVLLLCGVNSLP
jgi:hypothetical protein